MRQFSKTGTYAVMHFVVAVSVSFALTGDWRLALGIGVIEPLFQTVAYILHERIWDKVSPGVTQVGGNSAASGKAGLHPSHGV